MEQAQQAKTITSAVIIVLILGVGLLFYNKYAPSNTGQNPSASSGSAIVMVRNTPMVNGVLPPPAGFPSDVPLEKNEIIESATTDYPEQNAKQLSVSYTSSSTITEKYEEYKDYLRNAGYQIKEGTNSIARTIFGDKDGTSLSIAVSSSGGKTLVQLSYLLK